MIKILALLFAAAFAISGCSSSDSTSDDAASPSAEASSTTTVLPPIEVDGRGQINAKVGDVLNVTTEGVTEVTTNNATVLEVFVPTSTETAEFNGGAKVIGEGDANMIVYGPDEKKLYTVAVIVEGTVSSPSPGTVG